MKRISSFLKSFDFIFLLALVVLALVIYFYGPQVPVLQDYRIQALWTLAAIYVAYYLLCLIVWSVKKWRIRRARRRGEPEEAEILQYIGQVEKFLHHAAFDLGLRRSLKKLPLHWVTGSEHAGKSEFIRGCNEDPLKIRTLQLPLGQHSTSWHLSKRGVFFEWPLQETDGASQKLLIRLFKWTAKRPSRLGRLSDLIFVLPTEGLVLQSTAQLQAQCLSFTTLLKACAEGTGRLYPALLMVSQVDQLHGCQAFFDRADQQGEDTTWGTLIAGRQWHTATPESLQQAIAERIRQMYQQVTYEPVPAHLSSIEKLGRHGFPYQMQQLSLRLGEFLQILASESRALAHPGFSGVFAVASAKGAHERVLHGVRQSGFFKRQSDITWRQEGGPSLLLSGVHRVLAAGFSAPPVPSVKRSQRNLRKSVVVAMVLMSATVTALGITYSDWRSHEHMVAEFRLSVEQLASEYDQANSVPMTLMGLFSVATQNFEQMQQQRSYAGAIGVDLPLITAGTTERLERFLTAAMKDQFDTMLARSLEQALEKQTRQWAGLNEQQRSAQRDKYYGLLEAYLMKTRFAANMDPEKAAAAVAPVWFEAVMQRSVTQIDAPVIEVIRHTLAYFYAHGFDSEQAARWTSNHYSDRLVATARSNLAVEATADAIYQLLASRNQQRFDPVKLSDVIPPGYPYILRNDYQFSSMYSRGVWENHIEDEIKRTVQRVSMDDWVLDERYGERQTTPAAGPLEARVRELYFDDYRQHWEAYIQAFYMPQFDTLDEVHHNLQLLGGERTPLRPLSLNIQYQIGAYQQSSGQRQRVESLLGRAQSRFAPLQTFVEFYQIDGAPQFEQYLEDINRLAAEVESMLAAARVSQEALQYASAMLADQGSSQQLYALNLSINRIRLGHGPQAGELLQHVLLLPVKTTWQAVLNTAKDALQDEWERNIYAQYSAHLDGRFPFAQSSEDAPLSAFHEFFDTGEGTLWRFYRDMTAPFVTLHSNSIEHHTWLGMGLEFRADYLLALRQGRQIARAVTSQSDGDLGFRYALMPEPVPGITESRFVQDDFLLTYRNEPQQWRDHTWTAGRQNSLSRVQLRPSGQALTLTHQAHGSWSLLRLLHQAEASQVRSNEYELVWLLEDENGSAGSARYRFRSDQAGLLLNKQLFTGYRLPRQIL